MPKDKAISDQAFSSIQRKISNRGALHYNLICLAKTHYFYFNDNYINPFKGILLHTRPCACAPILNNFHRNSRIVRTHGRHSIVFDMVNNWFFVENVCLHHVEHFLWGNPNHISVLIIFNSPRMSNSKLVTLNLHTISHSKFVFVLVPLLRQDLD